MNWFGVALSRISQAEVGDPRSDEFGDAFDHAVLAGLPQLMSHPARRVDSKNSLFT